MCGVCGCGQSEAGELDHAHAYDHDRDHDHDHEHGHTHAHGGEPSHDHVHADSRLVRVERDILEKNDRFAAVNRRLFASTRTLALNLVSSPGSGKTALLVRTLGDLSPSVPLAVIEGDQQTSLDADRIKATGVRALQINTGKMCHLDASMICEACGQLELPARGVLFIENVGNLVCPAGFDLGEAAKIVLCSVTEGEDKPLKYPDIFQAARLVLVTKTDLLPHLEVDVAALEANVRKVNPAADFLRVSARTGEGLDAWYRWIKLRRGEAGGG